MSCGKVSNLAALFSLIIHWLQPVSSQSLGLRDIYALPTGGVGGGTGPGKVKPNNDGRMQGAGDEIHNERQRCALYK